MQCQSSYLGRFYVRYSTSSTFWKQFLIEHVNLDVNPLKRRNTGFGGQKEKRVSEAGFEPATCGLHLLYNYFNLLV